MPPKFVRLTCATFPLVAAMSGIASSPVIAGSPPATSPATLPAGADPAAANAKRALAEAARAAGREVTAGRPADARKALADAIARVGRSLPADSDAAGVLRLAVADAAAEADDRAAVDALLGGTAAAAAAIDFKPIVEAPLPEGFPGPGPVGRVVVKAYPAYRLARTPMTPGPDGQRADDGRPFRTLFRHIQSNKIAMTAPVEMSYTPTAAAAPAAAAASAASGTRPAAVGVARAAPTAMAFLYRTPAAGAAGKQGDVDVVDVPAVTVASVGLRGAYDDARVAEAIGRIEAWLKGQTEYERADGEPRLMGYNSPMVFPWLRFSEVQVPVRKR